MINGAQVPYRAPRTPTKRMSRKANSLLLRLRRWRRARTVGARQACESAAGGSDRRNRRDPACDLHADEPRLSRDPQADRAVLLRRPSARQGAARDVAAIRCAVPLLFDPFDHARAIGRAGAGRELGQSGGSHLLALAMEFQSVRDLPARLQRRRPLPDDRSGLRRGRAVLYPGPMPSPIPAAASPASISARSRAMPSNWHRCISTAMWRMFSTLRAM